MVVSVAQVSQIVDECQILNERYSDKLFINKDLDRSLVSFQANKVEPFYRWFKYKEGFSKSFVEYILDKFAKDDPTKVIFDPFAGSGTSLTVSAEKGHLAIGIELLPHAILALQARLASKHITHEDFQLAIKKLRKMDFFDADVSAEYFFPHVGITNGAFSSDNEVQIANFRRFLSQKRINQNIKLLLSLVAVDSLESCSYTRKDGQYLRWDYRSGKNAKSQFDKGKIAQFKERVFEKLESILDDLREPNNKEFHLPTLIQGSCLHKLLEVQSQSIDVVITSPPYCNRYDYTRTYALELAFLGVDDIRLKSLRQTLLSATVENRSKIQEMKTLYASIGRLDVFEYAYDVYRNHRALNEILAILEDQKDQLNNKNIIPMIANYFFEMNLVVTELSRILRPNGSVVMVNDNVQYNGYEIPVDMILSDFAVAAGLTVEKIWVLDRGKGNSSQQMGIHGRNEIRKCVYVWVKN